MRPVFVAAFVGLGMLVLAGPAGAHQANDDGFSICARDSAAGKPADFNIGPCQPLSAEAMRRFGLSKTQAEIVAALQGQMADRDASPPPQITHPSLTHVKPFIAVGSFADYWLADLTDAGNVNTGVHLRYVVDDDDKLRLRQMTYAADGREGHFTVVWNRILMAPRR